MKKRRPIVEACCGIAVCSAIVACPANPPQSAPSASPPTSATTTSSPTPPAPAPPLDDVQRLQGAVYLYCSAYETCTGQTNTPCMTMSMQYIETGCVKPMVAFYECADGAPCNDGWLDTSACDSARQAIDDCIARKK